MMHQPLYDAPEKKFLFYLLWEGAYVLLCFTRMVSNLNPWPKSSVRGNLFMVVHSVCSAGSNMQSLDLQAQRATEYKIVASTYRCMLPNLLSSLFTVGYRIKDAEVNGRCLLAIASTPKCLLAITAIPNVSVTHRLSETVTRSGLALSTHPLRCAAQLKQDTQSINFFFQLLIQPLKRRVHVRTELRV